MTDARRPADQHALACLTNWSHPADQTALTNVTGHTRTHTYETAPGRAESPARGASLPPGERVSRPGSESPARGVERQSNDSGSLTPARVGTLRLSSAAAFARSRLAGGWRSVEASLVEHRDQRRASAMPLV